MRQGPASFRSGESRQGKCDYDRLEATPCVCVCMRQGLVCTHTRCRECVPWLRSASGFRMRSFKHLFKEPWFYH